MRTKRSSRFDDYFKVQTYDYIAMCWRDIQKAHPTIEAAVAAFPAHEKCRIMRVSENGRTPVENTKDATRESDGAKWSELSGKSALSPAKKSK